MARGGLFLLQDFGIDHGLMAILAENIKWIKGYEPSGTNRIGAVILE